MKRIFMFLLLFCITQSVRADFTCNDTAVNYRAVYEPKTYTCADGYYLPANTYGCQPCPTGYTCPGGTFGFNENVYQGAILNNISTSTLNNVCAANFPIKLFAVYEPITINLNFDDGNGNVTSTTCEYGDTIVIPENVPTRPGYVFTGWVVRENN